MRYLIIDEVSEVFKSESFTEDEVDAVEDGLLQIIDTKAMKQLDLNNKWIDIKEWEAFWHE